jgi:hypothetical protein
MTNQEVNEFMQRFLDDDLNEEELESLMEHIRQTPASAALFERLQQLDNDLESLPKVIPPISIVDSILPRLELAGLVDHPPLTGTTASDEQDGTIQLARKTTTRARINYRWLGGVVAAGVILTLFITNFGPQTFNIANEDTASNNAVLEKMVAADVKTKSDQSAAATQPKLSEDKSKESAQMSSFAAPEAPNSESTAPAPDNSPAAASMETPWVDQGSMSDAGVANRRVADSKPEDDSRKMNIAFNNDAPPETNSSKSTKEIEQSTGDQVMFTVMQPSSAIASPDELLSGMITTVSDRSQQIIISDQNGQKIYESAVYEGTIAELAWSPDSEQLHFEVAKDNEDIVHMTIDLGTLTENVQALD